MMADRFRRGEFVRLREIPGLVGRVVTDLYACEPPQVQVTFAGGDPVCVPVAMIERIQFDTSTQEFRAIEQE